MPLTETIDINKNSKLYIWTITETVEGLLHSVKLNRYEKTKYESFKSISRKKEFLACRQISQSILGPNVHIENNQDGKPYLTNSNYNISISHSKNIVAIAIGDKDSLSLDIELVSERVHNITSRFLSEKETSDISTHISLDLLYIYWCTKECLIKLYGKKDIHLKNNLFVDKALLSDTNIKAHYIKEGNKKAFIFKYKRLKKHILVWCESSTQSTQE